MARLPWRSTQLVDCLASKGAHIVRWVQPSAPGLRGAPANAGAPGTSAAGHGSAILERIALYIPGEVIAVYTALFTLAVGLQSTASQRPWIAIGMIVFFLLITIIYVARNAPIGSVRGAHLIVSPLAFVAWAYPISSSLLGDFFHPLAAFALQVLVLGLSIIIKPR